MVFSSPGWKRPHERDSLTDADAHLLARELHEIAESVENDRSRGHVRAPTADHCAALPPSLTALNLLRNRFLSEHAVQRLIESSIGRTEHFKTL